MRNGVPMRKAWNRLELKTSGKESAHGSGSIIIPGYLPQGPKKKTGNTHDTPGGSRNRSMVFRVQKHGHRAEHGPSETILDMALGGSGATMPQGESAKPVPSEKPETLNHKPQTLNPVGKPQVGKRDTAQQVLKNPKRTKGNAPHITLNKKEYLFGVLKRLVVNPGILPGGPAP